jgi:chaperonin cofactor prefoldin
MNPDRLTTSQLLDCFTVAHWRALIGSVFVCLTTVAGAGYWVGQRFEESQSLANHAELRGTIAQLQAKLEASQLRSETFESSNLQLRENNQKLQEELSQKNVERSHLLAQVERSNNCSFIHEQIRATRIEMNGTGSMVVFEATKEWEEKQKTRRAVLEKRIEGYQKQLGTCNK